MVQLITADDRTGALETAAQCAVAGLTAAAVAVGRDDAEPSRLGVADVGVLVVDLGSRHLDAVGAASRMTRVLDGRSAWPAVHKIDSTLRGNWVAEIGSLVAAGRRVLLVPAFPAAGRVCRGGIVLEHGVPVDRTAHGRDPRSPSVTAEPVSALPGAVGLAHPVDVTQWCATGEPIGIADASTDDDLDAIVAALAGSLDGPAGRVVLAGPAAVAGAWARHRMRAADRQRATPQAPPTAIVGPVVVVCGSAHPIARAQVAALIDAGATVVSADDVDRLVEGAAVVVLAAPGLDLTTGGGVADDVDHERMAAALGRAARSAVARLGARTVVVVGGDTASAVVEDQPVRVHGLLGVGIAWGSVELDGRTLTVVTKPGGFGGPDTVVDLMRSLLQTATSADPAGDPAGDGDLA